MYDKNTDRITLPITDLFDMLSKAADEGIRIGKENTAGDHTASGTAYHVFMEYMRSGAKPTPPHGPIYRSREDEKEPRNRD